MDAIPIEICLALSQLTPVYGSCTLIHPQPAPAYCSLLAVSASIPATLAAFPPARRTPGTALSAS